MIDIVHAHGPDACGQVAFRYTERPRLGDAIRADRVRLLDGTTPDPGTLTRCGACGHIAGFAAYEPDGGYA